MENVKMLAYDYTESLKDFKEFFGDIAEEEKNDPAILVAVRRIRDSVHEYESDDPAYQIIKEVIDLLLKPVTTNNILDFVVLEKQFAEIINERNTNEETDN